MDILTVVIREVLNKRGRDNQCMVPIFHSTLRLDLYFPSANWEWNLCEISMEFLFSIDININYDRNRSTTKNKFIDILLRDKSPILRLLIT